MQLFSVNSRYLKPWHYPNASNWDNSKKVIQGSLFLPPVPSCPPGSGIRLVVIVCSAPQNFASRQAIRSTWGKDSIWTKSAKVFFVIGRTSQNVTDMFISMEKVEYGDVIHYNLVDSYYNLTLKSVSALKWATTRCPNAKYVMKTDDDMFVNIPLLQKSVLRFKLGNVVVGKLIVNARPIRNKSSKWYVPYETYVDQYYPNYLSGTGYVMSQSAAALLYNSSLTVPFISLEDVFITGICAKNESVKPIDSTLFTYAKQRKNPCRFLTIATAHRMTPNDLYEMWDLIHNIHFKCVTNFWNSIRL